MEERETPSLSQAGIQPVEEEIKASGFRVGFEGKVWPLVHLMVGYLPLWGGGLYKSH